MATIDVITFFLITMVVPAALGYIFGYLLGMWWR